MFVQNILRCCFYGIVFVALPLARQTPAPKADPAKATVFFFRYTEWHGNIVEPSVYCDGVQLARLDNGRYFAIEFDPGRHSCKSSHKQSLIELDLKAGETYYIRMEMEPGAFQTRGRLVPIGKVRGPIELRKTRPLSPEKVKDKKRVRLDLPPPDTPQ